MYRIKLDAIDSTNTFLKELVLDSRPQNFTVVTTESQRAGRGQMGTKWYSEPSKNLLFSVFVDSSSLLYSESIYLNFAVSWAIYSVLNTYEIKDLSIKWPNDILAGDFKIGGILIENTLSKLKIKHSIIGVGLNVNQELFSDDLVSVNSMKCLLGVEIDREDLLSKLLNSIQTQINNCCRDTFSEMKSRYLSVLYKINVPTIFKDTSNSTFGGKIVDVTDNGNLQIELKDGTLREFGSKEIQILRSV